MSDSTSKKITVVFATTYLWPVHLIRKSARISWRNTALVSCCALLLCDFICVNIYWPHVIGHIQLHITTNSRTLLQENTFENKPKKENNNKKKSWQEVKNKQSQTQEVVNQSCSKASEYPSGVWYGCVCTCVDTSVSWKQNLPILMCIHSKKQRNQRKHVYLFWEEIPWQVWLTRLKTQPVFFFSSFSTIYDI